MSETLLHAMIDKIDAGEKKINELSEKIDSLPNYSGALAEIKSTVELARSEVQKITFLERERDQVLKTLQTNVALFKQPVKQEIIHHHHASKLIWITAVLFIIICFEASAWYMTVNKLSVYKANDTKYRYLKLQNDRRLINWLNITDSLNSASSNFRNAVINKEHQNRKEFEIMQRPLEMEKEAKEELRNKISVKWK